MKVANCEGKDAIFSMHSLHIYSTIRPTYTLRCHNFNDDRDTKRKRRKVVLCCVLSTSIHP